AGSSRRDHSFRALALRSVSSESLAPHGLFFSGRPLRLVSANSSSCFSLIDSYISFDAPFNSDFFVSPRLADSAAPAAFCWAFDVAGMAVLRFVNVRMVKRHAATPVPTVTFRDRGRLDKCGPHR